MGQGWAATTPDAAARGVLHRLLPQYESHFVLETIPSENGLDAFEIDRAGDKIILRGSTGVAMASALNRYLADECHASVSNCGNQLDLPDPLPLPKAKLRVVTPFKYRYCFNYCAFGYSLAWYDWPQWERLIDWMALDGINMPLAATGQEATWQAVGRRLGLSDADMQQFFCGPAYLPWGWMGGIDGVAGPLPQSWIDSHLELGRKILARERELGMTPVLGGFYGHAPVALKKKFPDLQFQAVKGVGDAKRGWSGFPPTSFIHPADPRFKDVGKIFIEEQTRLFGTDHLYTGDPFIEMTPSSTDPAYLSGFARAVYQAMTAADPQAVWVQQGWFFSFDRKFWKPEQGKAFVSAVPAEHLLFLDLYCENVEIWKQTQAFFGKPWLWCIVGCFGNTVNLQGGLPQISERLPAAFSSPERGQLRGTGLLMEGLGYNPVVYDMMSDLGWQPRPLDLPAWVDAYTRRRYGRDDAHARAAWRVLLQTAYRRPARTGTLLEMRPDFKPGWRFTGLPYPPAELAKAWPELVAAATQLGQLDSFRFDLVNLGRQVLANYAGQVHARLMAAYQAQDRAEFERLRSEYLQLFPDLEELLATRREFLLGPWLADAERWAASDRERRLYHYNARRLITIWGTEEIPWNLNDYARKQWSGLLTDFYRPRWEMFLSRLDDALAKGEELDVAAYKRDIVAMEEAWVRRDEGFPTRPRGDSVEVSRRLMQKYYLRVSTETTAYPQ